MLEDAHHRSHHPPGPPIAKGRAPAKGDDHPPHLISDLYVRSTYIVINMISKVRAGGGQEISLSLSLCVCVCVYVCVYSLFRKYVLPMEEEDAQVSDLQPRVTDESVTTPNNVCVFA